MQERQSRFSDNRPPRFLDWSFDLAGRHGRFIRQLGRTFDAAEHNICASATDRLEGT
jgi:hypothetical protein